jgi:hypothetical protein
MLLAQTVPAIDAPTGEDKPGEGPLFLTTKNTENHQGCTKAANSPARRRETRFR